MFNGLISVLVVFILLAVGFYFTRCKKWPENANKVFSCAVIQIAAPSLAIVSIENRFTPELLHSSTINLIVIVISIVIMMLLGKFISHFFSFSREKKAVFEVTFSFNNTMFIGLPIIQIVFGHDGLPYLFTFYLATIVLFWTLGSYTLSKASSVSKAVFSFKNVLSPGLVGVLIGCLLASFECQLPIVLETALTYLGSTCVPLSLLVIGSNLAHSFNVRCIKITADQIIIMLAKFVIHPCLIYGIFSIIGIEWFPLHVFILTAAMPCHAQTAILAQFYEVEGEYASNLVSLSTLISLFSIPLYASFLL